MSAEEDRALQANGDVRGSTSAGGVFLSYASEDAAAAEQIAAALQGTGIQVWFDKSELRGGDVWDRQIRRQIRECALFVALVSSHSDARKEGYFRREWRLAVERMADLAEDVPFLLPVVIDDTQEATARIPDRFREVHWARLSRGEATASLVDRVQKLLSPEPSRTNYVAAPATRQQVPGPRWSAPRRSPRTVPVAVAVVLLAVLAYFAIDKAWIPNRGAAFAPPPHSIAVLPFANESGDANQEYFSDGISEELLGALSRLKDLQVVARTSSFSFKHQDIDAVTIARKLNVGAILEGSVRRSGNTVRITVQLINGITGFQIWTQTYDRLLDDALKLQSEVATSVAQHLEIKLSGDQTAKLELGGTRNAAAYDAYLIGLQRYENAHDSERDYRDALAAFDRAIALDPNFALAYARRAASLDYIYIYPADPGARPSLKAQARAAAEHALALAPQLGEAHLVLAYTYYRGEPDLPAAAREYDQAVSLSPGNAWVQRGFAWFAAKLGHFDVAVSAARRAVSIDDRNWLTHEVLAEVLIEARRFREALSPLDEAGALSPGSHIVESLRWGVLIASGQLAQARANCESSSQPLDDDDRYACLAIVYYRLGRQADSDREVQKLRALVGDEGAYDLAVVYAQVGDKESALRWLSVAEQRHAFDLLGIKVDWGFDPIRNEPQFKAVVARMNFPP
jgi:TolB-like protein/Flp pilus assembly protein TadD